MLAEERKSAILEILRADKSVKANELAEQFEVSEDTIRRDLRNLADAGLVRRVYGGAVPRTPVARTYSNRVSKSVESRAALVQEAIKLVQPHQTILLDAGSTGETLAMCLPVDIPLTVVTHSLPAAVALIEKPLVDVVVLGGMLLKETAATVGTEPVIGYRNIRADLCFLGLASFDIELGVGVLHYGDAEVKTAMMAAASEVVALASVEKVGTTAPFSLGPISAIDHLILEGPVSDLHLIESMINKVTVLDNFIE